MLPSVMAYEALLSRHRASPGRLKESSFGFSSLEDVLRFEPGV